MDVKQGPENTELVKEEQQTKKQYIFQKNAKTKIATYIILAFLVLLVVGVILSALFFSGPAA